MELKFMDNKKTDQYYIDKIITDLTFIRTHTESLSKSKLEEDEILVDSIMFRLIQVAESPDSEMQKKHLRRSGDFLFTVFLNQIVYFSISFFRCEEYFIVKRIAKIKKCKKQSGFFDVQVDHPVCI